MSRGDGRVFRRGARWYVAYYGPGPDGKATKIRESAGETEKEARALLKDRIRAVANDRDGLKKFVPPSARGVLMKDLFDAVVADYVIKGRKSLRTMEHHQTRPRTAFGHLPAVAVTTERVAAFIKARLDEKASRATVDRETETIARAFSLANEGDGTKYFPPHIPKTLVKNRNARKGFVERADFDAILGKIPDADFRDLLEFFYWTGMRPGEICSLTWADDDGESIILAAGEAKTDTARSIPYSRVPELAAVMARRVAGKSSSPLIFHRKGRTMAGTTGGFKRHLREMWREACAGVGLEGAIPYDLRRTAIRNMVRGGASVNASMGVSGHKTHDTFRRYDIIDTADRVNALVGAAAYVQTQAKDRKVLAFGKAAASGTGPKTGPKRGGDSRKGRK
ncbi:MAG TPA: site-specific integrase [Thermoanaerobaculia bacterium]